MAAVVAIAFVVVLLLVGASLSLRVVQQYEEDLLLWLGSIALAVAT